MTKHSTAPEWSYEETKKRLLSIPENNVREFACISYVCGLRINEARSIQAKNIYARSIPNGEIRAIIRVRNLKNPRREWKELPINPEKEKDYFQIIDEWHTQHENDPEAYPFHEYTERTYRKKIRKYLDIHPHALRHLRVHHIDDQSIPGMQGLSPRQYQDYFGWESIATSSQYQNRTRTIDLATKF